MSQMNVDIGDDSIPLISAIITISSIEVALRRRYFIWVP